MIKYVFHKEKLSAKDTVYEKHVLSFLRPVFCGYLTWRNLKGLVELANLTVISKLREEKTAKSNFLSSGPVYNHANITLL